MDDKLRIAILFCGGTIIMKKNEKTGALQAPDKKEEAIQCLNEIEPRVMDSYNVDVHYIDNIDSTNMTPQHWDLMAQRVFELYEKYDGFVITHGTDTMAYTASALSFALCDIGKPVVLTGSQIPGSVLGSDARRNLINSVILATKNIAGVFLLFDKRIIKGVRASKISESALDAFSSINESDIGSIRTEMELSNGIPQRHNKKLVIKSGFESDISVFILTPGCDATDVNHLLEVKRLKGIILCAFGTGNIPYDYHHVYENAKSKKIPIVVLSQCLNGTTDMVKYDVGNRALQYGVIEGKDMSLEAASVKLMWAIKRYAYDELADVFNTNFAGEVSG